MMETEAAERVRKGQSHRLALGITFLIAASAGSIGLVRMTSLRGLPAIEEPFDTRKYATIPIPDDENAYTYFRRAADRFIGQESDIAGGSGIYTAWSQISPETLRSLDQNRESLDLWLEGTKRDRAVYMQPGSSTLDTLLPVVQRLRSFTRLASLKAMRLRLDGDHAGAWAWIKANLRCGLLTGQNGFPIERLVGIAIYGGASADARQWADDPGVGAKILRRALADVLAAEAIAPDYAQMIRYEYYSVTNTLTDPVAIARALEVYGGTGRRTWRDEAARRLAPAYAFLRREPERSRRVIRHIVANWLSSCDLPAAERARRVVQFEGITLYRPSPGDPGRMAPEDLARWYGTTTYAKSLFTDWKYEAARRRDEQARAGLIVHLAERLFEKERGRPPTSPDEIVGPYLKALPAGYIRSPADASAQGSPR